MAERLRQLAGAGGKRGEGMKVCKFGGSSLADARRVREVVRIVASDARRRVVVVSAPGKRFADDIKVTDRLIECAAARLEGGSAEGPLAAVVERFAGIQQALRLPPRLAGAVEADLRGRLDCAGRLGRAAFLDLLKAAGEDNSARLVAEAMRAAGLPALYVNPGDAGLLLSDEYGNAQVLDESYTNLAALREMREIAVFPGFFGVTREGRVATFPRGGSDITGAILSAAVQAEMYENFTDVDSVFPVDPASVPGVALEPIPELTFREMRELSYAGFGVLHDEAIVPAVRAGIPICIRNTGNPDAGGTRIVGERARTERTVVGIASGAGFCTLYASLYLMNRQIGFGRRFLQVFEEEGLSYEHMPSGIDNVSIILRESGFPPETERRVLRRLRRDLGLQDAQVERGLALIMIVGEGMRYHVGLAARATGALAEAGVNIEMMNQGASEISMMFGVKAGDRSRSVASLYEAFFGGGRAATERGRGR